MKLTHYSFVYCLALAGLLLAFSAGCVNTRASLSGEARYLPTGPDDSKVQIVVQFRVADH